MVVQRVTLQQARRFAPNITRERVIRGGQQFVQFRSGKEFVVPKVVLKDFVAENIKKEGGVIVSSGISEKFLERLGGEFRISGKTVSREEFVRRKAQAQARGIQVSKKVKRPITTEERQLFSRLIRRKVGSVDVRPTKEFLEKSGIGTPKGFREGDVVRITVIEREVPEKVERPQIREQLQKIVQKERFEFIPKAIRRKPEEKPSKKIVDLSKKSFIDPRRIPTETKFQKKIFSKIEKAREKTTKFVSKGIGKIPVLGESEVVREGIAGGIVALPGIILFDVPQVLSDPRRVQRDLSEGGKQVELLTKIALPAKASPVEATVEERSFARKALLKAGIELITVGLIAKKGFDTFRIIKTKAGEFVAKKGDLSKEKIKQIREVIEKISKPKVKPEPKPFLREIKVELSKKKIDQVVKSNLRKKGVDFDSLSIIDKEFLRGQVKAKLINQPELFLPEARKIALEKARKVGEPIRITEKAKKLRERQTKRLEDDFKKLLEIKAKTQPELFLPRVRRIALQRARKAGKPVRLTEEAKNLRDQQIGKLQDEFKEFIKRKARIKPEVFLPEARKIALEKARKAGKPVRLTEEAKVLREAREEKLREDFKGFLKRKLRIKPEIFLSKSRKVTLEKARKAGKPVRLTDKAIKLREKQRNQILDEFKSFLEKKARVSPEDLLPSARKLTLQKVEAIKTLTKAQKGAVKLSKIIGKRKNPTKSSIKIRPTNQNVENILNNELVRRDLIKKEIPKEQLNKLRKAIKEKLTLQPEIKIPKPTKVQTIALRRVKKLPKKPEKRFIDFGKKARIVEKKIEKQIKEGKARVTKDGQIILLDKPKIKQLKKEVVRLDKEIRIKQKKLARTKKRKKRKTIQEEFEELAPQPKEEGVIYAYEYSEPFAFPGLKSELISKGIAKRDTKLELVKVKNQLRKQLLKPELTQKQKTAIISQLKQLKTLENLKLDKRKAFLITTLAPKVLDEALEKQRVLDVQKEIVKNKGIQKIFTVQEKIKKEIFKETQLQKDLQKRLDKVRKKVRQKQLLKSELIVKRRVLKRKKKKEILEAALKKLRKSKSFDVFVKERGKFVKKNIKPLPQGKALKLGSRITDNTLAATFRVRKTLKKTKQKDIKFNVDKKVFRTFKRRRGVKIPIQRTFIERRKFRLNTPGERRQIKGAQRKKKR